MHLFFIPHVTENKRHLSDCHKLQEWVIPEKIHNPMMEGTVFLPPPST